MVPRERRDPAARLVRVAQHGRAERTRRIAPAEAPRQPAEPTWPRAAAVPHDAADEQPGGRRAAAERQPLRVRPGHAARAAAPAVPDQGVHPAGWFIASVTILPTALVAHPVRRGHRAAARHPDPPARRAVVHRRGQRARRRPRGQPDRHRAADRRRRRLGDLRRPRRAQDPRGDRRDAGAGHRPDPAARGAAGARLDARRGAAQRPGLASSASPAATSSTWSCRAARRARTWRASPRSPSCPTCTSARSRRWSSARIAALVASYKGLNAGGGPKGVGDAVNQSRRHHVHAAVRRQLRHDRGLLPGRPAEARLTA